MSQSVPNFLNAFEQLTESEQGEITAAILKRTLNLDFDSLTDEELIQSAEELFLELDKQEYDGDVLIDGITY